MTGWAPVALTAAAAAVLTLPSPADLRLRAVLPQAGAGRSQPAGRRRGRPLTSRARLARAVLPPAVAAGTALGWGLGPAGAVAGLAGGAAAARALRQRTSARAQAAEREAAVEACTALAAELRSGRGAADSLDVCVPLARGPSRLALRRAAATARWGGDVAAALREPDGLAGAVPEVLLGLAACWQVCGTAGGGLAAAVDRLADGLRARRAHERAVHAALAGPRASALLLALLPLAGIGLAAGLGADPLRVLFSTPWGTTCLLAGLGLDATGWWWTRRLTSGASGARE